MLNPLVSLCTGLLLLAVSVCATAMAGESRISSVLGLKVRPSSATFLPRAPSCPPMASRTLRPMARLRLSLTLTTASTIRVGLS